MEITSKLPIFRSIFFFEKSEKYIEKTNFEPSRHLFKGTFPTYRHKVVMILKRGGGARSDSHQTKVLPDPILTMQTILRLRITKYCNCNWRVNGEWNGRKIDSDIKNLTSGSFFEGVVNMPVSQVFSAVTFVNYFYVRIIVPTSTLVGREELYTQLGFFLFRLFWPIDLSNVESCE